MFSRVDGNTGLEECILEIRKANGFDKDRYYKQDKKNILMYLIGWIQEIDINAVWKC